MERYARGDDAAFAELYERVAPQVHRFLSSRTSDPALAQDLLQQTLLQAHRARDSFLPGAEVMPWLRTIARRLLIDHARRERGLAFVDNVDQLGAVDPRAGAQGILEARELASRIDDEVARLPEPQRVAFDLMKRQGLSLAEAAGRLQITVGALKLRLHRAHGTLRAALAAELR
jgi:RNA polymerase sigma-70 factor (ECF subfamily)